MSRMKKQIVEEKPEEILVVDGVQLDGNELYRLLYFDAKIKNLELSKRLRQKEVEDQIRLIKQTFEVFEKETGRQKDLVYDEMKQTKDDIEKKYNIKLSECTFDELTGKLKKLTEEA